MPKTPFPSPQEYFGEKDQFPSPLEYFGLKPEESILAPSDLMGAVKSVDPYAFPAEKPAVMGEPDIGRLIEDPIIKKTAIEHLAGKEVPFYSPRAFKDAYHYALGASIPQQENIPMETLRHGINIAAGIPKLALAYPEFIAQIAKQTGKSYVEAGKIAGRILAGSEQLVSEGATQTARETHQMLTGFVEPGYSAVKYPFTGDPEDYAKATHDPVMTVLPLLAALGVGPKVGRGVKGAFRKAAKPKEVPITAEEILGAEMPKPEIKAKPEIEPRVKPEKPIIPETPDIQIEAIQKLSRGELSTEALKIYTEGGIAEGNAAIRIAKMSPEELQHVVSGGRIGKAAVFEKPKVAPKEAITEKPSPEPAKPEIVVGAQAGEAMGAIKEPVPKVTKPKAEVGGEGDLLDWKIARRKKAEEIGTIRDPQKRIELANKAEKEFEQSAKPGWVINNQPFAKIRVDAKRAIEGEVPKPKVTKGKEPWEMTRNEFANQHPEMEKVSAENITGSLWKKVRSEHKQSVEQALSEGKPVPAEVLKDYPDLLPKTGKPKPVKPEITPQAPKELIGFKPTKEAVPETQNVPIKEIRTDVDRFQNRFAEFSEETAQAIAKRYDPNKFDPIVLWKDSKTGENYVLSGHSRLEGLRRRGETEIPSRFFKGTEEQAGNFATIEANRLQAKETLAESVRAYQKAKKAGYPKARMKDLFGSELNTLEAIQHLDSKGKFMEVLGQTQIITEFPFIKRFATWVGKLRGEYGEKLTGRHEGQIFDFLYKEGRKNIDIFQDDFMNLIRKNVDRKDWTPNQPLVLKRGEIPSVGTRARADTGWIEKEMERLRDLKKIARTKEEIAVYEADIRKLSAGITTILKRQGDIFGTEPKVGPMGEIQAYAPEGRAKRTQQILEQVGLFGESKKIKAGEAKQAGFLDKIDKGMVEKAIRKRLATPEEVKRVQAETSVKPKGKEPESMEMDLMAEKTRRGMEIEMEAKAGKKKPQTLPEIISGLQENLNVPIRKGHISRAAKAKGALGVYKRGPEAIRIKEANDIVVASHEVGHHLYKTKGIQKLINEDLRYIDEIQKLDYDIKRQSINEGFSEFLRHYMSDESAQIVAPEFYKRFEKYLKENPEVGRPIKIARDQILRWRKQGADKRVEAWMSFDKARPTNSIAARLKWGIEAFRRAFDDANLPVRRMEEQIEKKIGRKLRGHESAFQIMTAIKKKSGARAAQWMDKATVDFDGKVTGPALRDILKIVKRKEHEAIRYAGARHAIERWKNKKNPGLELVDLKYYVEKHKSPKFDKFADELEAYRDRLLQYVVDSGGFSAKTAALFRSYYDHALPLYANLAENIGGHGGGRGIADLKSPYKRAKGGGEQRVNVLSGLIYETYRMLSWADRARASKMIAELAMKYDGIGKFIEPVEFGARPFKISMEEIIKKMEEAGIEVENIGIENADMAQLLTFFETQKKGIPQENIVTLFMEDGSVRAFQLNREIFRAVKMLDVIQVPSYLEAFHFMKNMVTAGATGLRPSFGLGTNFFRDLGTKYFTTERKIYDPITGTAKVIAADVSVAAHKLRMRKDPLFDLMQNVGAEHTTFFNTEIPKAVRTAKSVIRDSRRAKALNVVLHPIRLLREIINVPELGPRLDEARLFYDKILKETKSERAAWVETLNQFQDVTLNFPKAGYLADWINQFIPFFNPSLRGIGKMASTIRQHPYRTLARGGIITSAALSLWNLNKEKEWYKALPAWDKYGFWHFAVEDDKGEVTIYRVPRPYEWGYLFCAIPEGFAESIYKSDPDALKTALSETIRTTVPDFLPPVIEIPVELTVGSGGYDYFRDRPIVPWTETMHKVPAERYGTYTTEVAKYLGALAGVSPRKIEHGISGFTGGLGMDILRGVDRTIKKTPMEKADMPYLSRFITRSPYISKLYDEIESLKSASLLTGTRTSRLRRLERDAGRISRLNKRIRKITERDMSPEEKKAKIRELNKKRERIAREAVFGR